MTNFERKPGDKGNVNATQIDPVQELTRLLGRKNLSTDWEKSTNSDQDFFMQRSQNNINNDDYTPQSRRELEDRVVSADDQWFDKKNSFDSQGRHWKDEQEMPYGNREQVYHNEGSNAYGADDVVHRNSVHDEVPYWSDQARGMPADELQWENPLAKDQLFADQYGVPANESKHAEKSDQSLADNNHSLSDSRSGEGQNFINDSSLYEDGLHFFDELSQYKSNINYLLGSAANWQYNQQAVVNSDNFHFIQSRYYRTVLPPLVMVAESHSFLGYGQAVAVFPYKGLIDRSSKSILKSRVRLKEGNAFIPDRGVNADFVESGGSDVPRPPLSQAASAFSAAKAAPEMTRNLQSSLDFQAGDGFEDALNDFNLTIKDDKKKHYKRDAGLKIIRPDQNSVPETKSFDLPLVRYDEVDHSVDQALPFDQEFSDVLASGVPDDPNYSYTDSQGSRLAGFLQQDKMSDFSEALQDTHVPLDDDEVDVSKYNWSATADDVVHHHVSVRSYKKVYLLVCSLVLVLVCLLGYYMFFAGANLSNEPVIIRRDAEAIKVVPKVETNSSNNQDQMLYNRGDNSEASQHKQLGLVDHSEAPVDLDRVEENQPSINSNQSSLDTDSVNSNVLEAIDNSVPIYEVPTVKIDGKNLDGNVINAAVASQKEVILKPGENFKQSLTEKNNAQQVLLDDNLSDNSEKKVAEDTRVDNPASQFKDTAKSPIDDEVIGVQAKRESSVIEMQQGNSVVEVPQEDSVIETQQGNDVIKAPYGKDNLESFMQKSNEKLANKIAAQSIENNEPSGSDTSSHFDVPGGSANLSNRSQKLAEEQNKVMEEKNVAMQSEVESTLPASLFYVQIASHPTRAASEQSLVDIKRRVPQFNSLLGKHKVGIVAADIPGKGTYYRVRIATDNQVDAIQLCNKLRDANLSCFIGK